MNSNSTLSSLTPWRHSAARDKLLKIKTICSENPVTLVVPPVALLDRPALSVHILQGCAAQDSQTAVGIFYANLCFGAWLGLSTNNDLCYLSPRYLLSERLFAQVAYGVPKLGQQSQETYLTMLREEFQGEKQFGLTYAELQQLAEDIENWVNDIAQTLVSLNSQVIGCTTIFEQTAASIAILNAVKRLSPHTITIIGGANCTGEMAAGIASLGSTIDYIFSGEADAQFPQFLKQLQQGQLPTEKIIHCSPYFDLDTIPTPNYQEFFEQQQHFFSSSSPKDDNPHAFPISTDLPFESSRGCWWGMKHQCTFCGMDKDSLTYRQKSASRALSELKELVSTYSIKAILAYDSIMPHTYFKELLPKLKEELSGVDLFYEQKANISLAQMRQLKEAHIEVIQPGIEALSSSLLKRMNKGVTADRNIATLRYARACGVAPNWNLLCGFPGDSWQDYQETLALLPLLQHLTPPAILCQLNLDRFSPYFMQPEQFGIRNLRPLDSYAQVLPKQAHIDKIAYRFNGDYDSAIFTYPELIPQLNQAIVTWRSHWVPSAEIHNPRLILPPTAETETRLPTLQVTQLSTDCYQLRDTRQLPTVDKSLQSINRNQAQAALVSYPLSTPLLSADTRQWALDHQVAIIMDNKWVPLATAHPDLLAEFEHHTHHIPILSERERI